MPLFRLHTAEYESTGLDRGEADRSVDIVAVHGLNENRIDAWTEPRSQKLWLRDLLPIARVLTFGYDAHTLSCDGSGSAGRLQQHAHTLVAELQSDRALGGRSQRPIIFVCHGIGGILVKKALAYSSTRTSKMVDHLYSIFVSTFAILFFGTPHNGADKFNWLVPPNARNSKHRTRSSEQNPLLSAIEKGSETLEAVTEHFATLMKHFRIFFFWEEVRTDFGDRAGFVVEESSAAPILANTERCGIHATHSDMVRFSGTQSSSYRTVIEAIERYCRNAPPVIAHRWQHATTSLERARLHEAFELTGTVFDTHNDERHPLYQHKRNTSEIVCNKHFYIPQVVSSVFTGRENMSELVAESLLVEETSVLSRQQRRFIVYGIGGSGKTQFCSKFAQDHRERFFAVFYVDASSTENAKSSFANIGKTGGLEATQSAGKHWLSHLEEPWLLIINNADDPSLDLQSLIPEGERGHILVTTRNPNFRVHGTGTVGWTEFKGLETEEALHLLLKAGGVPRPWDASTEDAGHKITNALGYLPLALVQAGALLVQTSCKVEGFLSFYKEHQARARARQPANGRRDNDQYSTHSTWDLSLDTLERRCTETSRDAAQLLNIVAFFHFEHIRVDIFTRAVSNRSNALGGWIQKSFAAKILRTIHDRLQPPLVLPDFLRQEAANLCPYRVRKALLELHSFSLISYVGRDDTFSLHPLVHEWARDRLGRGGQTVWAHVALNTLAESILLPPSDNGKDHEEFRRDILPHLDICLLACPIHIVDFEAQFGRYGLPFTLVTKYMSLQNFRLQVLKAAKCGYVYAERGRFKDAAALLSMVKDALVQSRGYENEFTQKAMLALAGTYWGLGRLWEAVALQKIVVDARARVLGPEHCDTLSAMDQLGRSYWLNGQYHEAIELQTLTTERMKATLGHAHGDTLAAMDNLGVTLGSWQRYHESMEVHRQVLDFRENKLGPTHVDTLTTMNNLAMALLDLGRGAEAKDIILKVYEERKLKLGKEHPWTLWALCNLAKIHSELGHLQEAENLLLPGIEAAKRSLSADHLGVLMGCGELARVFARQGRLEEAESLTNDTIQRLEQSRGLEHPDTVYALWKMAQLYEMQNRNEKAIELCELAVERASMRLTKLHPLGQAVDSYLRKLKHPFQTQEEGSSRRTTRPTSPKGTDDQRFTTSWKFLAKEVLRRAMTAPA